MKQITFKNLLDFGLFFLDEDYNTLYRKSSDRNYYKIAYRGIDNNFYLSRDGFVIDIDQDTKVTPFPFVVEREPPCHKQSKA